MIKRLHLLLCLTTLVVMQCFAQEQEPKLFGKLTNSITNLDTKLIDKLDKQYKKTEERLTKQTSKWLKKTQKQEEKLKRKLAKTDSLKAEQVFGDVKGRYKKLQDQLNKKGEKVKQYIPVFDSLNTTTKFLEQNINKSNTVVSGSNQSLIAIKELNGTVVSLQQKMQNASNIKKQLQQRKEQLKQQLKNTIIAKQLQGFNKQVFYYQQQVNDYKELFDTPDRLAEKAIGFVRENSAFKDFFVGNSRLAELFKTPNSTTISGGGASVGGLQTSASVMQALQQRFGSFISNNGLNGNAQNLIKDKLDIAKGELDKVKEKMGSNGGSDNDMPNFKPNRQKTKTFLKRLEYGYNIQSQKNNTLLPTTSDIAATLGYKLNDKTTVGLGLAYKLGWGNGWKNINLSNQGVGFRSYFDVKFPQSDKRRSLWNYLTNNLWLSGGYELNYLPELKTKLNNVNNSFNKINHWGIGWQDAALIGISKKQKIGKKTATIQLLYNAIYQESSPQTQPLLFRVGWSK